MNAQTEIPVATPVASTYEDELNMILEEEKQLAEKKKSLMLKKQLGSPDFQKQFLEKTKSNLLDEKKDNEADKLIFEERIAKLQKEIEEYEGKISDLEERDETITELVESIEGIDFETDAVDDFIVENFKDEAIEYIEEQNSIKTTLAKVLEQNIKKAINKPAKKSVAKKSAEETASVSSISSGESKSRKSPVITKTMKPADRWAIIPAGSMFRAKHKEVVRYYKKLETGNVCECDKDGKNLNNGTIYKGNQEAANAFKLIAGMTYAISGWEFLQLYNKETDKAKSLKKWDGDANYLNW